MPYIRNQSPKDSIIIKIFKYLFFNFILTTSPILINIFVSITNQIPYRDAISYCPDICFMTIVTASNSIKESFMSKTIRKKNYIIGGLLIFNVAFIVFSMIIYGNIVKDLMSPDIEAKITNPQFVFSLAFYILSVILGLGIQVGGGIDE